MHTTFLFLKTFLHKIKRQGHYGVGLATAGLLLTGGLLFAFLEGRSITDSLWWAAATITTVGYGDISPVTPEGRIIGFLLMVTGIGFLGLFTANISSLFVEKRLLENKGMKAVRETGHFVICGWNSQGPDIVSELLADAKLVAKKIVILAELEETPVYEEQVAFVRGQVTAQNIEKISLPEADSVILLSDDRAEPQYRDAKLVMDILALKAACPAVYLCVGLADAGSVDHAKNAGADEIIVANELISNLLVQAALDHGVTQMVSELTSNSYGNELYTFAVPAELTGTEFFHALCTLKKEKNILCLGLQRAGDNSILTNPPATLKLSRGDILLAMADNRMS